jgi:hypothetical protein
MNFTFFLYFVVPIIMITIITLIGVVLLLIDSRRKSKEGGTNHDEWQTIGGKVISSQMGEARADGSYDPSVKYVYTVNGAEHQGVAVFSGRRADATKNTAQEILDQYTVNVYVPVRYNPENPSDSILDAARPNANNYTRFFGWLLTGFGIISCCFTVLMAFIIFSSALSYN